jgi:hypothetical protein
MKATIFYDQIASAVKASKFLQSFEPKREIKVDWEINLWHIGILRFHSVADEALKLGAGAHVIVFAGCQANSLRPWTLKWLERWVSTRLIEHAILALVDDEFADIYPQIGASELSTFAGRHNIAFVACGNIIDEMNQLGGRECVLSAIPLRDRHCNSGDISIPSPH